MRIGMAAICQNPFDERSDADVYVNELRLASLAEPLGFDSLWSVEHHFTDYTMVPDVLQFLSYFAGRTQRVQLGSMVVVLPWHDPMRAAEEISLIDHLCGGRYILGIGRGAGRVEFEGFRIDMGESRERFVEAAQIVLGGLESGHCELDGKFYKQPKKAIRPKPLRSFKGRTYAAAVSPESARIMAELGIGILVIPQKPWDVIDAELAMYRKIYREVNGADAPKPIKIGGYWESAQRHYEFGGEHFAKTKGYEFYAAMSEAQRMSANQATEAYLDLQVWGTPAMCLDRIRKTGDRMGSEHFSCVFSYAGMPYAEAERNLRQFASEVMPKLQRE